MGLIAPTKYEYFHIDAAIRNRILFRYWFTLAVPLSSGDGADFDLRLGVGPSGRESGGVLVAASVAVSGSSSDFNFELRTTPSASGASGTQWEVYQREAIDTWFKVDNINVPYRTTALYAASAMSAVTSATSAHNGQGKLWGYVINNTATTITNIFIELILDVDQAIGVGFGWWDPLAAPNEAWKGCDGNEHPPLR